MEEKDDNKSVATGIHFNVLAMLCEKISNNPGKDKKKTILKKFVAHWRNLHKELHSDSKTKDSFFPALRLLLPHLDKDRFSYGMKEVVLAKYYIDVLNISKNSVDGKRLLNYKAPSAKQNAGDFASVAYSVLENRCPVKGSQTIDDINKSLDEMARANMEGCRDVTKKELHKIIRATTALEQKWIIRIILKDLKLGVSENSIFPVYHPDAQDLYNVCNSLSKVATDLHDPNVKLNEMEITLLLPFRPMLGQRCEIDAVEKLMHHQDFFIETKIDGERFQIHKDGEQYQYFTRNANDYTQTFGATKFLGTLTPRIHKLFKSNIKNCILDGEMVAYDPEIKDFVLKGSNVDVKSELRDGLQTCFVVFDVVMMNNENFANIPLKDRCVKLNQIFDGVSGTLEIVERKVARSKEDVLGAVNDAIDRREEGIVVKDPLSIYQPSKRKGSGWLKIKPEYVDGLSDDVDLLILAGKYGSGHRGGMISDFILGIAKSPIEDGEKPKEFMTFTKVGSGYTDQELKKLLDKLNKHWRKFNPASPPSCIQFSNGCREKPDVWIEPCDSVVVQIKATEITVSEKYACGCTLRFPRLEKVRDDKCWYDCMTHEELEDLRKTSDGLLAHKNTEDAVQEPNKKKRRLAERIEKPVSVGEQFRGADVRNVEKSCRVFEGREFVVMNGSDTSPKKYLEKRIAEFGGTFSQNSGAHTMCVVAGKVNFRVKNIINRGSIDVVKVDWLVGCFEKNRLIPYRPSDMHYSTPKTERQFRVEFDSFGDSYTESTNSSKLAVLFSRMGDSAFLERNEIAEMEEKYFPYDSTLGLFRKATLYVSDDCAQSDFVVLEFRFHGGGTCDALNEASHVMTKCGSNSLPKLRTEIRSLHLKPHIVTESWVRDCISANKILSESMYEPK